MEDTARYRFELVPQGEDEDDTPYIAVTPTRKGLPQLQEGKLAITLVSGTTVGQANMLVKFLNEAVDRISFTTENEEVEE